jgi:tetratricopeptide (TPR) repeat protein
MAGVAANAPSPEGWQLAKPLIEQLYVQQDRPLKEVRAYLAEHRNFLATERMFKQRLKEWGFDRKKVKAAEWRYMLRVTRQRRNQGKDSAFRVNGKVIVWSNIRKHLKRKKKTEDEFLSAGPEAEVVEDVVCYTPLGSPHLSTTRTASAHGLGSANRSTHTSYGSAQSTPEQWRGCFPNYPFSPEPEQSRVQNANIAKYSGYYMPPPSSSATLTPESYNCFSPALSSECSSIPDPELQSIALRPINIKSLPPLDEAAALRISRMMSGSHNRSIPVPLSERGPQNLTMALEPDQTDSSSSSSTLKVPGNSHNADLSLDTDRQLSDEDIASRWVVYYFQACICESQGDHKSMQENVKQASLVFKNMLNRFNPYLLTGLTLMTSILYFHDHAELLKQFLEDSCRVIEKVFSKEHPIIVPYRYMLVSVCGDQPEKSAMSNELDHAYKAFQLTWGQVHSNTLTALYYYGCSLLEGSNFEEAETQLRTCFELSRENLGPSHFLTVWTLATISRTLSTSNRGRESEAVNCLQDAIKRCRRMMHEEHPYYLELNRNLAKIHLKLGNLHEVESLYRLVLRGRIKMLGLGREITKASVNDLYDVLTARNKRQEAAQLRVDIVAMENRGEGHSTHGISY